MKRLISISIEVIFWSNSTSSMAIRCHTIVVKNRSMCSLNNWSKALRLFHRPLHMSITHSWRCVTANSTSAENKYFRGTVIPIFGVPLWHCPKMHAKVFLNMTDGSRIQYVAYDLTSHATQRHSISKNPFSPTPWSGIGHTIYALFRIRLLGEKEHTSFSRLRYICSA